MENYISSGKDKRNDIEIRRKILLLYIICSIGTMALVPLGILSLVEDYPTLGYFDLLVAVVLVVICICLRKTGYHILYSYLGLSIVGALFVYLFATGGANNTGHLWYYIFPLVTSFLLGSKRGAILTSTIFALAILVFLLQDYSPIIIKYSKNFKIRFVFSFLVLSGFSYCYEYAREKAQQ